MDILYTFKSFFQEIFSNSKNKSVFSVTNVTEKQFPLFRHACRRGVWPMDIKNAGSAKKPAFFM